MTKEEILKSIKDLGYRFSTNNPMNSLGVILYGKNPKFKNDNGRFSLTGTNSEPSNASAAKPKDSSRKKRVLSPAARERIATAQRARWAKAKKK